MYRVAIRTMRIRDSHAMNRDRFALSEKYEGDDQSLLTFFNLPLLAHASTLEISQDAGASWEVTPLSEAVYMELTEAFVIEWLTLVMNANPQYGYDQIEMLKKTLIPLIGSEMNFPG